MALVPRTISVIDGGKAGELASVSFPPEPGLSAKANPYSGEFNGRDVEAGEAVAHKELLSKLPIPRHKWSTTVTMNNKTFT